MSGVLESLVWSSGYAFLSSDFETKNSKISPKFIFRLTREQLTISCAESQDSQSQNAQGRDFQFYLSDTQLLCPRFFQTQIREEHIYICM